MKVKELIEHLKLLKDQDATVVVVTSNFEQGHNKVLANNLFEFKGDLKEETFRDAFDGGTYNKKVVKWNENGKTNFIEIT